MADEPRRPALRLTSREELLFEAGIKLGGIFHQYLGIPVTRETAPGLARTIEAAVRLQPFVHDVRVVIRPGPSAPGGPRRFAYHYLTAEMLEARVTLSARGTEVRARLKYRPHLGYPLMEVDGIRAAAPRAHRANRRHRATIARRSVRR